MTTVTITLAGYQRSALIGQCLLEFGAARSDLALEKLIRLMKEESRCGGLPADDELVARHMVHAGMTVILSAISAKGDGIEAFQHAATSLGAGIIKALRPARAALDHLEQGVDPDAVFSDRIRDVSAGVDRLVLTRKLEAGRRAASTIEGDAA